MGDGEWDIFDGAELVDRYLEFTAGGGASTHTYICIN